MATIACVLRHGGDYDASYVQRLYAGASRHCPPDTEFVLLTDEQWSDSLPFRAIVIPDMLPGWWAKMHLFIPGSFTGRVVYIDLDSIITDNLDPLLTYDGPPLILRDFNEGRFPHLVGAVGGAVITWTGDELSGVWEAFSRNPEHFMQQGRLKRSDFFLRDHLPANMGRVQDVFPGLVACAKHALPRREFIDGVPEGAAIVTSWGKPRLHELAPEHWLRKRWEGRAA